MTKLALAISTALLSITLGAGAALATPTVVTGTSIPPLLAPPGVDDALQIFLNGTQVAGFPITVGAEAACAVTDSGIGGCSFERGNFTFGPVTISPNLAMANQIAVFYLPGTTTIDAVFALGCERNPATGLCTDTPSFVVLTTNAAHPFDFSILPSVNVGIGFTGTEIAGGGPTAFDVTNFITVTGAIRDQIYTARLVLNNVPEPVTLSLFGAGLLGAVAMRRRKRA